MSTPDSLPSSSLEIRLFYIRLSPCARSAAVATTSAPSHLTLDISGHRVVPLRRDRLDRTAGEATYVSTDSLRLATSVADFEVSDERGNLLLCGNIERVGGTWSNGKIGWSLACYSAVSGFTGKTEVEVYMAGCFSGTPVILTQTVQLSPRSKKLPTPGPLHSIPEDKPEEDELQLDYNCKMGLGYYYQQEDEDGQLSWFNAGVRVGVGIGLGMCVGVGIGVGLLLRSYQATTQTFRRRFF